MKKIFIFFFIPLLSFSSILEDKIYASAQNACYLKNSTNGLSPTDYSPIVSSQTLRNSNEEDYYSSSDANEVCNNWNSNPYVNVDTELYAVTAEMSCTVTQYDDNGQTKWKSKVDIYTLNINCNVACEVPRKANGDIYSKYPNFNASQCTLENIQALLDSHYSKGSYIADDAQYLSCSDTPSLTSCYFDYHLNLDTNTTDSNETSNDLNNSSITDGLSNLDNSINKLNNDLSSKSSDIDNSVSDLKAQLAKDNDIRRRQLDKIIEETNRTANIAGTNMLTLYDINYSLNSMNEFMRSELNNTDIETTIDNAIDEANSTVDGITTKLNILISSMSSYVGSVPVVTGIGNPIFTANVYGSDIVFDFSMIEDLKQYFDILWVLLLAYFNFKIYVIIIRDLMKKI